MEEDVLPQTDSSELITVRNVMATREAVFKAWTDPVHLKAWWGPKRFTTTFREFDCRKGGKWHYIFHGPGKRDYITECEFMEVAQPELLAWRHLSEPQFIAVATFRAITKRITSITFTMQFDSAETCASIKHLSMFKTEETFDKLEVELERIEPISASFKSR
jgi:uncharacterized protein YndB with AHSA1/START domain